MSIKRLSAFLLLVQFSLCLVAQNSVPKTQCGIPTGQQIYPLKDYVELQNPVKPSPEMWKSESGFQISWGSKSVRYSSTDVPVVAKEGHQTLKGWKGERVFTQAVLWTKEPASNVSYSISDFKKKVSDFKKPGQKQNKATIPSSAVEAGFVRYVMADKVEQAGQSTCGDRSNHKLFDSLMVADCIDTYSKSMNMSAMQTQGIWLTIWIPQTASAGEYSGTLTIKVGDKVAGELNLDLVVEDMTLPSPSQWEYHLDLWQNPYSVARYHQVPVWSKKHFKALEPIMTRLGQAGQKVITTTVINRPWSGQTEDAFDSMITWKKKANGDWEYDYTIFDKWVSSMMKWGIDKQINCYSMAPWNLTFSYFDEASGKVVETLARPGEQAYSDLWKPFLTAFAQHLKSKGWFEITAIAMDERPVEMMEAVIAVVRDAVPDFKIALAGNYFPEVEKEIYDYCLIYGQRFPDNVLQRRRLGGKISTYYTCCGPARPNTFVFSEPDEAEEIGLEMIARGADGYLRWAYNSWPLEPLLDTRFRTWAAGDTFLVYPGNRTSIRFERLIDGIQSFEKIKVYSK